MEVVDVIVWNKMHDLVFDECWDTLQPLVSKCLWDGAHEMIWDKIDDNIRDFSFYEVIKKDLKNE